MAVKTAAEVEGKKWKKLSSSVVVEAERGLNVAKDGLQKGASAFKATYTTMGSVLKTGLLGGVRLDVWFRCVVH